MCNDYNNGTFKDINEYKSLVHSISLKSYSEIVTICRPYFEPLISKLKNRQITFKRKYTMTLNGRLAVSSFCENELIEQKHQLEIIISKLKQFDTTQLPIFIISYDLRRTTMLF